MSPRGADADISPALEVVKSVHSAFLGKPDLHKWLRAQGVSADEITSVTRASLHGHFATVLSTAAILDAARKDPAMSA